MRGVPHRRRHARGGCQTRDRAAITPRPRDHPDARPVHRSWPAPRPAIKSAQPTQIAGHGHPPCHNGCSADRATGMRVPPARPTQRIHGRRCDMSPTRCAPPPPPHGTTSTRSPSPSPLWRTRGGAATTGDSTASARPCRCPRRAESTTPQPSQADSRPSLDAKLTSRPVRNGIDARTAGFVTRRGPTDCGV
jgi:hypothetical protein